MNKKRLFVIDTELQDIVGHSYNATTRIIESALLNDFSDIIAAINFSFSGSFPEFSSPSEFRVTIERHFLSYAFNRWDQRHYQRVLDIATCKYKNYDGYSFCCELEDLFAKYNANASDTVVIHTCSAPILLGIYFYFLKNNHNNVPTFNIMMYMAPGDIQGNENINVSVVGLLKIFRSMNLINSKLRFYVEFKRIQEAYQKEGFDFDLCMGPVVLSEIQSVSSSGCYHIGHLGEARREKGITMIPSIIENIRLLSPDLFKKLYFHVQISSKGDNGKNPQVIKAKEKLALLASSNSNIFLYESLSVQEYDALLDRLDAVILPYDLMSYHVRGSGVAYEALAKKKVIFVSPGIDITVTFPFDNVIPAASFNSLGFSETIINKIVSTEIQKVDRLKAYNFLQHFSLHNFAKNFLVNHVEPVKQSQKRNILVFCAATFSGGVGFVQRAQLYALNRLGYRIYCVILYWPLARLDEKAANVNMWNRVNTEREKYGICIDDGHMMYLPLLESDANKCFDENVHNMMYINNTVHTYYSRMKGAEFSKIKFLESIEFDCVIVNYVFYYSVLERMNINYKSLILESLDFQTKQMHFRRKEEYMKWEIDSPKQESELIESDFLTEMKLCSRFDKLVHISEDLKASFVKNLPQKEHVVVRPCITHYFKKMAIKMDEFCVANSSIFNLLKVAQFASSVHMYTAYEKLHEKKPTSIDLLFVGGAHSSNVYSIRYFIDQIYRPYLLNAGVNLFVVGSVCNELSDYVDDCFVLGEIDNVIPIIQSAKINILAVEDGTGFPTKVIEILSLAQAFCISQYGLYELAEQAPSFFPVLSNVNEWLLDIVALLTLRPLRANRGRKAREFSKQFFSEASYVSNWKEILNCDSQFFNDTNFPLTHTEMSFYDNPLIDTILLKKLFHESFFYKLLGSITETNLHYGCFKRIAMAMTGNYNILHNNRFENDSRFVFNLHA